MLKFFRRIRQKLLADNPPVGSGRALKIIYATGEIAWVWIGMLLARQVNNWNQNRKNKVLVESYTSSLIENLSKDNLNISETLSKIWNEMIELTFWKKGFHPNFSLRYMG